MSDSGRFEALLSHQGPLVHVDHSFRAPAPRTGECYSITSSEVIKARFFVQRGEVRNTGTYILEELDCGDARKPKVSLEETKRVMGALVRMAGEETTRFPQTSLDIQMKRKQRDYLVRVDPNREVESWLSPAGRDAFESEDAEDFENGAISRLQTFLSDDYEEKDGQLFILKEP